MSASEMRPPFSSISKIFLPPNTPPGLTLPSCLFEILIGSTCKSSICVLFSLLFNLRKSSFPSSISMIFSVLSYFWVYLVVFSLSPMFCTSTSSLIFLDAIFDFSLASFFCCLDKCTCSFSSTRFLTFWLEMVEFIKTCGVWTSPRL